MPRIEKKHLLNAPVEKVYEILNNYDSLPVWNIVVNEVTEMEPKKYFLKTNVGDIINTEIENIPLKKMTSTQEGSPMEKIGYIFESKGEKTEVTIWTEFELENQNEPDPESVWTDDRFWSTNSIRGHRRQLLP